MIKNIDDYIQEVDNFNSDNKKEIENFKNKYLSKKNGVISYLFKYLKNVDNIKKKQIGLKINLLKDKVLNKVEFLKLNNIILNDSFDDITKPFIFANLGSRHPINITINKIFNIFNKIGFNLFEGPEIEDEWHNFTSLNVKKDHPARDMQDTFFIGNKKKYLLRTHTSSVQIRCLSKNNPPVRFLSFGKVYRNETISSRSHIMFNQIEGMYIDKNVTFGDLKRVIFYFIKELFGNIKVRFRPSYFPFTEPSAEIDIYWGLKNEIDYKMTKGTGWLEIMGCGMVDPKVLENVNIDNNIYNGYAFGMGVERIALLLYQIGDIRLYSENDIRFIDQFKNIIL